MALRLPPSSSPWELGWSGEALRPVPCALAPGPVALSFSLVHPPALPPLLFESWKEIVPSPIQVGP